MSEYVFKPRFWPTVMTIPILICLLLLGNWQLQRLEWKLGLIKQIEERAFMPPVHLPESTGNLDMLEYQSVMVEGMFNNEQEMTMYSVGPNGEPGYDLYTPLTDISGQTIIVNRGWVPEQIKNRQDRPNTIVNNQVIVQGLLRKPGKKLWYGPENEPENNTWFYGDLDRMAEYHDLKNIYPMYLFASKAEDDNSFPVAGRTEFNIVNNHLDYALTWFGLAVVLSAIYLIVHIKKKER